MPAATVEISESNTVSETVTDGISNINLGNNDSANLVTATYPITAGANSYEKWVRFHVSAMGSATKVDNLRVYAPGATFPVSVGTYLLTSATTSGYSAPTFATPVTTTSSSATNNIATSAPGSANLGIGGSLSGSFAAPGYSDYCVLQLQTNASDTASSSVTVRFRYDEVA